MLTIAAAIRRIRERRGLSQTALARLAGVDRSVVSRWEAGTRQPSLETLRHLALMARLTPEERLELAVALMDQDSGADCAAEFDAGCLAVWPAAPGRARVTVRAIGELGEGEVVIILRKTEVWRAALLLARAAARMGEVA